MFNSNAKALVISSCEVIITGGYRLGFYFEATPDVYILNTADGMIEKQSSMNIGREGHAIAFL